VNKRGRIVRVFSAPTGKRATIPFKTRKVDRIIVASVVPGALAKTKSALKRNFPGTRISVVGENVKVPMPCVYNKRQIGQDRLVTAFAAKELYGLPILIVDFGTAVTFDAVSKRGAYVGGLIVPGIKMSLESLSLGTAMLPKTYLKRTRSFIGRDTRSSIRSGMIYGYAAMCDGLIALFRKKIGKDLKVVSTGGDARLISRYTRSLRKVDPHLSLKGLYLLS
jgi:type III pantothenate kinase